MKTYVRIIIGFVIVMISITVTSCFNNTAVDDKNNYNSYINKIWIPKDWGNGKEYNGFSFIITEMKNEFITGKIIKDYLIRPDLYTNKWIDSEESGYFRGSIYNDVANCEYKYNDDKGDIAFVFKEDNEIETYTKRRLNESQEYIIDSCVYRPYNVSDWKSNFEELDSAREKLVEENILELYDENEVVVNAFLPSKIRRYNFDLDSWGNVNLETGLRIGGYRPPPYFAYAYITDAEDNIIYRFEELVACEIIDINVEDINGDGLKDIEFIGDFSDTSYYEGQRKIYLQMNNGWFCDSDLADVWTGMYEFKEANASDVRISYYSYIYKEDNDYFAEIEIYKRFESTTEKTKIKAKVVADETKAEFIFEEYLPDNEVESESFKQGDVLLAFEKRYVYELLTEWGKLQPILPENQESGKTYFEKGL